MKRVSCCYTDSAAVGWIEEGVDDTGHEAFERNQHRIDYAAAGTNHQDGDIQDGQQHHWS